MTQIGQAGRIGSDNIERRRSVPQETNKRLVNETAEQLKELLSYDRIRVEDQTRNSQAVDKDEIQILDDNKWNEALTIVRELNLDIREEVIEKLSAELYNDYPINNLMPVAHLNPENLAEGLKEKFEYELESPQISGVEEIAEGVYLLGEAENTINLGEVERFSQQRQASTNNPTGIQINMAPREATVTTDSGNLERPTISIRHPRPQGSIRTSAARDPVEGMDKLKFSESWKEFFKTKEGFNALIEVIGEIQGQNMYKATVDKNMEDNSTFRRNLARINPFFAIQNEEIENNKILRGKSDDVTIKNRFFINRLLSPIADKITEDAGNPTKIAMAVISKYGLTFNHTTKSVEEMNGN